MKKILRKKIAVGNLKMKLLNKAEAEKYCELFKKGKSLAKLKNTELIICPPFVYLQNFVDNFKGKNIFVGVQDVFWEKEGPFTGEISPVMAKNSGVTHAIIGHSERRRIFGETNETANLKIKAALKENLIPIYCIGETEKERMAGETKLVISNQLAEGLSGISRLNIEKIIVAYEPVWAIGTDRAPAVNEIMEARILIRKIIFGMFPAKPINGPMIIYGGSVSEKTAKKVCVESGMDGILVGRESLNIHGFFEIAGIIEKDNH